MWLPKDVVNTVERAAHFHYVSSSDCQRWNGHRREGELRLLTGWAWTAKDGSNQRQGFKTLTVAIRDCYYDLIRHQGAPAFDRRRGLRVVAPDRKHA
jgi:hypothetical protein